MRLVFLHRLRAICVGTACAAAAALSAQEAPTTDWKTANDTVGRFLRGHVDLLRWEQANAATSKTPSGAVAHPQAAPLDLDTALTRSLAQRPDLFAKPGMGAQELRALDAEWARWRHTVHTAWIDATLTQRLSDLQRRSLEGSEAADELAERMAAVGNWTKAQRMDQALALSSARAQAATAQLAADQARQRLNMLAGLDNAPATPAPPGAVSALPQWPALPDLASWAFWRSSASDMERTALERHPAWPSVSAEAQRLQTGLGTQWATWQAYAAEAARESLQAARAPRIDPRRIPWNHSLEKAVEIQGEAATLEAGLRDAVRTARAQLATAHALALQAQTRLDLQTALEQETLLRYNGMFKSAWELIAAAQSRLGAEAQAHQALADFWRAHADLQALLAGAPYAGPAGLTDSAAPAASPKGH